MRCSIAVATVAGLAAALLALPAPAGGDPLDLLPLSTTPDRRIVDSSGRQVLLRGANVNSLGEYWQGVGDHDPTVPVTDADWDAMAARGFSVVRLIVTWSRIEPTRGAIDQGYLDQVAAAVDAAAARGIYTVIDMHQDAYSASISTTDPASCPAGTSPAKGWDGAPGWATLTDGLSTCLRSGERNDSPAVQAAWNHFYDDTDGIRARFVASWAAVAERFAGRPEVAGFDLLNEPEATRPAAEMTPLYEDLLAKVIEAIRAAEADAPFEHLLFVEPALPTADPALGLVVPDPSRAGVDTHNVVAAVHNYAESIGIAGVDASLEGMNDLIETVTAGLGVPQWTGEYGFWDTSPETLAKARRYAADEDRRAWGGAWWQWRQGCGDPHSVQWQGDQVVVPAHVSTHLNLLGCPGDVDRGPNDAFLDILGRGYPRAAPGRVTLIESDPDTGVLRVHGQADAAGGELVVWTPTADPPVEVDGLVDVRETVVPGGRIVTARVAAPGSYGLAVGTSVDLPPTAPPTPGPAPAEPVDAPADFTG